MQWQPGWMPNGWGFNLSCASQITTALGGSPTNLAFTTHIYYYSPADLTPYWDQSSIDNDAGGIPDTEAQLATDFSALQTSMGVSAPLVFNEAGDCASQTAKIANDYIWWNNFCQAAFADVISVQAYFWARPSPTGLGPFSEGLIATAPYSPNTFGSDFITDSQAGNIALSSSSSPAYAITITSTYGNPTESGTAVASSSYTPTPNQPKNIFDKI